MSVDGVAIQEPKSRHVQHKFALHKMSYCADDKSDKRIVTFIAKEKDSDQHKCYVFDSEKCVSLRQTTLSILSRILLNCRLVMCELVSVTEQRTI